MSYTIMIGEPKIYRDEFEDKYIAYIWINDATDDNAPNLGFGDVSGNTNYRSPSYSGFASFISETGLNELFCDEEKGLLNICDKYEHSAAKLNQNHLDMLDKVIEEYKKAHPDCIKQVVDVKLESDIYKALNYTDKMEYVDSLPLDWNYSKLLWYRFWFKWALDNCEYPDIIIK